MTSTNELVDHFTALLANMAEQLPPNQRGSFAIEMLLNILNVYDQGQRNLVKAAIDPTNDLLTVVNGQRQNIDQLLTLLSAWSPLLPRLQKDLNQILPAAQVLISHLSQLNK